MVAPRRVSGRRGLPLPHEHGAWVMLYAPLLTSLAVYRPGWGLSVLLALSATAAFFAQNALGLLLRQRGDERTWHWLAGFTVIVLTTIALLISAGHIRVIGLGLPAFMLFTWQAIRRRVTHRQVDHSLINELLTVAILALGAPAAVIVARSAVTSEALLSWLTFYLYFAGSVLFVKMIISVPRQQTQVSLRWHRGGVCLTYHLIVFIGCLIWATQAPADLQPVLVFGVVGFVPVLLRTVVAWWRLDSQLPSLRRVGLQELAVSMWFSMWLGLALARHAAALGGIDG